MAQMRVAPRVLLLMPSTSYRAHDFLSAARRLGIEVVVGSDHRQVLEDLAGGRSLSLRFTPIGEGLARILEYARQHPLRAVVGTDDESAVLAATAAKALRLRHNDPASVALARDKHRFRQALVRAGMRSPWFRYIAADEDPEALARAIDYPCVLKPLGLSGSRGVIRADDAAGFVAACRRVRRILENSGGPAPRGGSPILAEGFIPGREVALEGLLEGGRLRTLALFDKPDPLDGPFFEETIYVTPSRLPESAQREVSDEAARAARALGLREGPVHAELRVNGAGAWMIELAARTIGGLCSRALGHAWGEPLEERVLRHALALPAHETSASAGAAGVMMIPVPRAGRLRGIAGIDDARAVSGIREVVISVAIGERLVPPPEGDRYPGFIFAGASLPAQAEAALRNAHAKLRFDIDPSGP